MSYLLRVYFGFTGEGGDAQKDVAATFLLDAATKMNALPKLKWKIWALKPDYPGAYFEANALYLYPIKEAAQSRVDEPKETLSRFLGIVNV